MDLIEKENTKKEFFVTTPPAQDMYEGSNDNGDNFGDEQAVTQDIVDGVFSAKLSNMTINNEKENIDTSCDVTIWKAYLPAHLSTKKVELYALEGDFKNKYCNFRLKYLGSKGQIIGSKYFPRLFIPTGRGWLFPVEKMSEVETALMNENIAFNINTFDRAKIENSKKEKKRQYAKMYREKNRQLLREKAKKYRQKTQSINQIFENAAKNGHIDAVRMLLSKGVDPSADNNCAIRLAAGYGHHEVVKLLLTDDRVDPSACDNIAISESAEEGYVEVVKLLLADERVDPSDGEAISWAAKNGHHQVVKMLLADGRSNPSAWNNQAICNAASSGHHQIVKMLLADERVDPSDKDNWIIRIAAGNGHIEVVKLLLKDGRADPLANNNEAIKWADQNGHVEIVNILEEFSSFFL